MELSGHSQPGANGEFYYAIHECFYEGGDRLPHRWTASPVSVSGETHAELLTTLQQMHRAVLELGGKKYDREN